MSESKFAEATKKALDDAREMASEAGVNEVMPLHLAAVLARDKVGILPRAIVKAASSKWGEGTVQFFESKLSKMLRKRAGKQKGRTSSSAPPLIPPKDSRSLENVIKRAWSAQNNRTLNSPIEVGKLVLGLLSDSEISKYLSHDLLVDVELVRVEVEKILGSQSQALEMYGRDLVAQASNLPPVIGRVDEIRRVAKILFSYKKNNAVLVGEPGVGKTAVVEGLAQHIALGKFSRLEGVRLIALDMGKLIAGAKQPGDFEERLQNVLKEVLEAKGKVILFIDEIHTVLGAGSTEGSMDAANLMKPLLGRGQLWCIGATTLEEYRKYIEKDDAFKRRFQKVEVAEPNIHDTIYILRGLKDKFQWYHGVRIQDSALVAAAKLSARYIVDERLPDKAITLVDMACTLASVQMESPPVQMEDLEEEESKLNVELHSLMQEEDEASKARCHAINGRLEVVRKDLEDQKTKYDPSEQWIRMYRHLRQDMLQEETKHQELNFKHEIMVALIKYKLQHIKKRMTSLRELLKEVRKSDKARKDMEEQLQEHMKRLEKQKNRYIKHETFAESYTSSEVVIHAVTVGPTQIAEAVSRRTGIPVNRVGQDERVSLSGLAERLEERVIGQTDAVNAVVKALQMSRFFPALKPQPIGSFLFLGPTGVGKTELAKALADQLFNDESRIIRIDMSEYMEEHSVARLIGAPPGYTGYEDAGQLTEKVRRQPYSVILFDEAEKAHDKVFDALLQVLGEGRLTDGQGKTVDFTNTVIIMTSNLGAEHLEQSMEGDHDSISNENNSPHDLVMEMVKKRFRPELRGRFSDILIFNPLSGEPLMKVARLQVKAAEDRVAQNGITLSVTDDALNLILSWSGGQYGAREIGKLIEKKVIGKLLDMRLEEMIVGDCTVEVNKADGKDELQFKEVTSTAGTGQNSDSPTQERKRPHPDSERCTNNKRPRQQEVEPAVQVWKFERGKQLVEPGLVKLLPTQMRKFHAWYMKKSAADPEHNIVVRVKETDYFNGVDVFYLDFKDIYEVYHRGALDISLVSCWVLMEIQRCRKEQIYDVGFMDPIVINQKTINDHREAVKQRVVKFFINQYFKQFILLPYNWGFHWILLIIEPETGIINVLDSMRKPTSDYDEVMDVLNDAWREVRESQSGLRTELKLRPNFSCFRQAQGTNVCGYYVCEFIHNCVTQRDMRMLQMRDELLPKYKIKAVQKDLMGFIYNEIILETGEFFDTGVPLPPPNDYVPNA